MAKRGAGCWESRLSGSERDWGATDVWPRYCGTTGKPGGNREHKLLPAALGVPSLLDKNTSGPANVYARQSSHSPRYLLELLYPTTSDSYRTHFRRSRCLPTSATTYSSSQGLAGLHEVGGAPRHRVQSKNSSVSRYQHLSIYCPCHNAFVFCLK